MKSHFNSLRVCGRTKVLCGVVLLMNAVVAPVLADEPILPLKFEQLRSDPEKFQAACQKIFDAVLLSTTESGWANSDSLSLSSADSMEERAAKIAVATLRDAFSRHGQGYITRLTYRYPSYDIIRRPTEIVLAEQRYSGAVEVEFTNVVIAFNAQIPVVSELDRLNNRDVVHFEAHLVLQPKYYRIRAVGTWGDWQPMVTSGESLGFLQMSSLADLGMRLRLAWLMDVEIAQPLLKPGLIGSKILESLPLNARAPGQADLESLPSFPGAPFDSDGLIQGDVGHLSGGLLRADRHKLPNANILSWCIRFGSVRRSGGETIHLWAISDEFAGFGGAVSESDPNWWRKAFGFATASPDKPLPLGAAARARVINATNWSELIEPAKSRERSFLGPDRLGLDVVSAKEQNSRAITTVPDRLSRQGHFGGFTVTSQTSHVLLGFKETLRDVVAKPGEMVTLRGEPVGGGEYDVRWEFIPALAVQPGKVPTWRPVIADEVTMWIASKTREGEPRPTLNLSRKPWKVSFLELRGQRSPGKQESVFAVNPQNVCELRIHNASGPCEGTYRLVLSNSVGQVSTECSLRMLSAEPPPDLQSPNIPYPFQNPIYEQIDSPSGQEFSHPSAVGSSLPAEPPILEFSYPVGVQSRVVERLIRELQQAIQSSGEFRFHSLNVKAQESDYVLQLRIENVEILPTAEKQSFGVNVNGVMFSVKCAATAQWKFYGKAKTFAEGRTTVVSDEANVKVPFQRDRYGKRRHPTSDEALVFAKQNGPLDDLAAQAVTRLSNQISLQIKLPK